MGTEGEPLRSDEPVTVFRERRLPQPGYLAGYSYLIERYDLRVPLHHEMAAISTKHSRRREDGWSMHSIALRPSETIIDQLVFALKYEGVHLLTLKELFSTIEATPLEEAIRSKPTSAYIRRLCFLYEWIMERALDVPNSNAGAYVEALDMKHQYTGSGFNNSKRFRIRNNLPGGKDFCPVVFRTHRIDNFIDANLSSKAKSIVASAPKELIARAAAFLLLSDSKASFAIEGENPPKDRIARWGAVIGKSGQIELTIEQLLRLQKELIGDTRFVRIGLRTEGGFVGRHDALGQPEPEHFSANSEDLVDLLNGLIEFEKISADLDFDAVLTAACIAFGFVYIHPFEDGNGRLHRFLMHHVLSKRNYTPNELIFPISSVILEDIARYKDVLETVSRPLLEWVEWKPTDRGNVDVINVTTDYYRYFDATAHCEFMFKCIQRVVERDLPNEIAFLEHRDEFHQMINSIVDMSERKIDLLLRFLGQGHGKLSKRATQVEFSLLEPHEVSKIESIYLDLFSRGNEQPDLFE